MWRNKTQVLVAVTSSAPPYVYDTPNLLSLPSEAQFRFRYQKKWVAPTVAAKTSGLLKGRILLVFHSLETGNLVPLREGRVGQLEALGPVVYVRFAAGRFFDGLTSEVDEHGSPADVTAACRKLLALPPKTDLKQPLPPEHYLRYAGENVDRFKWAEKAQASEWWSVVSRLEDEPALKELPFFFVLGLSKENFKQVDWRGLSLNRRYRLRILEWCFKKDRVDPGAAHAGTKPGEGSPGGIVGRVSCLASPELLTLEAASNRIVGQYDVVDLDFVSQRRGKAQLTIELAPEAEQAAEERSRWQQSFRTSIPIRVSRAWWALALRFLGGAVGASLYLWIGPMAEAKKWGPNGIKEGLQFIGLYILVLFLGGLGEKAVSTGKDVRELGKKE